MKQYRTYEEDKHGCVTLYSADGRHSCFIQGEDAAQFLDDMETAENNFRATKTFPTIECFIDMLISQYDEVMEEE